MYTWSFPDTQKGYHWRFPRMILTFLGGKKETNQNLPSHPAQRGRDYSLETNSFIRCHDVLYFDQANRDCVSSVIQEISSYRSGRVSVNTNLCWKTCWMTCFHIDFPVPTQSLEKQMICIRLVHCCKVSINARFNSHSRERKSWYSRFKIAVIWQAVRGQIELLCRPAFQLLYKISLRHPDNKVNNSERVSRLAG